MKQIEKFFSLETPCDKKHRANTCNNPVPHEYLSAIENGCSIEKLEEMMCKKFDVFKYTTQITIHGVFPTLTNNRVGSYVNLVQNKNKSIGVKYTAIDHDKKERLFDMLTNVSDWHSYENSSRYCIYKSKQLPMDFENHREEILETVKRYNAIADSIDRSLFFGSVSCYILKGVYFPYIVLDVNINCFYEKNFSKLFENISGMSIEDGNRIYEEKKENERLEEIEREKRREEGRKIAEKALERGRKLVSDFLENNPAPKGFTKVENYQQASGDILTRLYFNRVEQTLSWVETRCKKCFGKMYEKPTDKKYGEYPYRRVKLPFVYVKRA